MATGAPTSYAAPRMVSRRDDEFDTLIIGAGMAGLTAGALLAEAGERVLVLEAHDKPGGYAHTFEVGGYGLCAQVHYVFGCGEGEPIDVLLRRLGLERDVTFERLDPEGFDHVVVAGERHRIPNGHAKHRDRLIARYPSARTPLIRYFDAVMAIERELDLFPSRVSLRDVVTAPLRFPKLLRYRDATLTTLFDETRMPRRLRAVLAGQAGDYLLPPSQVSLLLHVALVRAYDRGAYYPTRHFSHFIDAIARSLASRPGCELRLRARVERILLERGRVMGVTLQGGETLTARRYVSNADPRSTAALLPPGALGHALGRALDYEYSCGTLTAYLGVRGLDLREHGFGNFNVWHYPHDDLDELYRAQNVDHRFDDPWLFLSTPTLHSPEPGLCPPGDQILEIATSAAYAPFARLRATDRRRYNAEKKRLRDHLVDIVERAYVPGLSRHLALRVMGTPATNARFCLAPEGNSYGAALTPRQVRSARVPHETALSNLFLANATAGYPSIGGAVRAGLDLVDLLAR